MRRLDRLMNGWPYGVHGLFCLAIGLALGAWWTQVQGGDFEAVSNVAQLLSASVALGGLWLAFFGVQQQRRDAEAQAGKFERQVLAAEKAAEAAIFAANAAEERAWRERRERLVRVAAQCESAAGGVGSVSDHPQLAGMGMGPRFPRSPTEPPADPASLPTELRAIATALVAVLAGAGELPPRNVQAIANAIVKLEGAAKTLALCVEDGGDDLEVMAVPMMQKNVAGVIDQVARDLHAAADEATRLIAQLDNERPTSPK